MRALPGDEFLLSPSPCELTMPRDPVEPRSIFARLDRSNDGQDHAVLPYAAHPASPKGLRKALAPFVRTQKDLTRFISPWSRIRVPDAAASTAPRPTFVTTDDRPSPWAGMGDGYRNSEFR